MLNKFTHIFFLGVGGIGMSALARFFASTGKIVSGYDRNPSKITSQLQEENISIIFDDQADLIASEFQDTAKTLVILTPAIKEENTILQYFEANGFEVLKRSEILGIITESLKTIAVAGTHGKTSVSCIIAHLLWQSPVGCTAILGGISKNYQTNFLMTGDSEFAVTEADEFDKSFLKLHPYYAVITSADADHLDIFGSHEFLLSAFHEFAGLINPKGILLIKKDIGINTNNLPVQSIYTYSLNNNTADVYAKNIRVSDDFMTFDLITSGLIINNLEMISTGLINIENAVAAAFIALQAGISENELRMGLKSFLGVHRRFDRQFVTENIIYIDDYAHHPEEIKALVNSIRAMYPKKKITGIFQPHLFSRTRDFATDFAKSLELLDEIILLEIYPAREKPIQGVSSNLIYQKIKKQTKVLINKSALPEYIESRDMEILLTIGAGDIDRLVEPIRLMLEKKTIGDQS